MMTTKRLDELEAAANPTLQSIMAFTVFVFTVFTCCPPAVYVVPAALRQLLRRMKSCIRRTRIRCSVSICQDDFCMRPSCIRYIPRWFRRCTCMLPRCQTRGSLKTRHPAHVFFKDDDLDGLATVYGHALVRFWQYFPSIFFKCTFASSGLSFRVTLLA